MNVFLRRIDGVCWFKPHTRYKRTVGLRLL